MPTDVGGMAIVYRTELFAEAGFPTDRDDVGRPWPTWEDFIDTGRRYTTETGEAFLDNAATSIFCQAVNLGTQRRIQGDETQGG